MNLAHRWLCLSAYWSFRRETRFLGVWWAIRKLRSSSPCFRVARDSGAIHIVDTPPIFQVANVAYTAVMSPLASTGRVALRIWIFWFLTSATFTVISIAYIDRPLASFIDTHFRHTLGWVVLDRSLKPLKVVAISALFFLFWAGYRTVSGYGLQPWAVKALVCSWSVVWGLAAELVFKQIFGRAWPDPTYTQHHLYGFRFLHGSQDWMSFPSGTAIGSTALATTLASLFPRLRVVIAVLAGVVCIAVVVGNYHWLSDSIAGAFLGVSIGWMSTALLDVSIPNKRESIRERVRP